MGRSFVLKDRMNMPAGYLTQGLQAVRCRITGAKEGMTAILLHKDGGMSERAIATSGAEQEWSDEMEEIVGVVIVRGAEIAADSGAEARMRYERRVRQARKADAAPRESSGNENRPAESSPPERKEEKASDRQERAQEKRTAAFMTPERRWPPPPCQSRAVYQEGKWTEGNA